MTYETTAHFAQTWGLMIFVVLFACVLVYALWPGNGEKFKRAAHAPLDESSEKDENYGGQR